MNDPIVLGFYTQLFMFQQDSKRQEFVFYSPDPFIQDTLHSLARMLGLQYEHSIRPSQVRISRPSHTPYFELSQLIDTQSKVAIHPTSELEKAGMQIVQTFSPIPGSLHTTELHPNENVSAGLSLEGFLGKAYMDLEWASKRNLCFAEENILNSSLTNSILFNNISSMAGKIPSAITFSNQSYLEVGAQAPTFAGKDSAEFPAESWPPGAERGVSRSALGQSTTAAPVSTDIQFIFEPTPSSGKSNCRGRRGSLNSSAFVESQYIKAQGGACWKCRILRKKVCIKFHRSLR
jgi:hypothetical protein